MPDREKVIKGLECCTNPTMEPCLHSCPYRELYDPKNGFKNCMSALLPDAIALLKKQEPILRISTNANSPWISRCPRCGKKIEGKQTRFCAKGIEINAEHICEIIELFKQLREGKWE